MKILVLTLSSLVAMSSFAFAKTVTVQGEPARGIMEALASANFPVSNIDDEWAGKTLTVATPAITCEYNIANAPDEWMTNVQCATATHRGQILANSLAIAKAIAPYADTDAGLGNRWISANAIKCSLVYDKKAYACQLDIQGLNN